jgi:hypothetical protein
VVEQRVGDHLHLLTLDGGAARSEARQVSNRSLLDDRCPSIRRLKPAQT